jgi:SAM-dependent methyltransferase
MQFRKLFRLKRTRTESREARVASPDLVLVERSKARWRGDEPDVGLTWGARWDGSAFIDATKQYYSFAASTRILEVGPGYGRLLDQILSEGLPFQSYLGLDISKARVERLTQKYHADRRIEFLYGDVENADLGRHFDLCISSATFAHLYPDCGKGLRNVARHLGDGGKITFDLQGGRSRGKFQPDGVTYERGYDVDDIRRLSRDDGLTVIGWQDIKHGIGSDGADIFYLFICLGAP